MKILLVGFSLFMGFLATAACPPDYMAVTRFGRESCEQKIWRDLTLYDSVSRFFRLPRLASEGWSEWKMCLNGTLGAGASRFGITLRGPSGKLAKMIAKYGRRNMFVFLDFEDRRKTARSKSKPSPFPLTAGETFDVTAAISNGTLTYTFCGTTCFSEERELLDTNLRSVQLNVQSSDAMLNLWYL